MRGDATADPVVLEKLLSSFQVDELLHANTTSKKMDELLNSYSTRESHRPSKSLAGISVISYSCASVKKSRKRGASMHTLSTHLDHSSFSKTDSLSLFQRESVITS